MRLCGGNERTCDSGGSSAGANGIFFGLFSVKMMGVLERGKNEAFCYSFLGLE